MILFKKILPYLTILFAFYFLFALYQGLLTIDWQEVQSAIRVIESETFFKVLLIASINYLVLISFDQLAIIYLGERVSKLKVTRTAFISYVLNLNFGALLGSVGVRLRLYQKLGIHPLRIPFIVIFSSLGNWIAYLFLFGLIIFISPPSFLISFSTFLVKSAATLALMISLLYLIACLRGWSFNIKSTLFKLPKLNLALAQIILGCIQWMLQGLMIYTVFKFYDIPLSYYDVLATFLVAAVAGVITHIPSGLGVLEAVFLGLTPSTFHPQVLASLLCFRGIYYLLPLSFALPGYIILEARGIFQSTNQH